MEKSKLSQELAQFSKDVAALPPAQRDAVYEAIRKSLGPVKSSRTIAGGEVVHTRDVDFTTIEAAIPPDLRPDWRQIHRDLNDAAKRHGNQWADESFAYIVTKRILPQPTAGENLVASTPGLVEAIVKAMPSRLPAPPPPTVDMEKLADMVAARLKAEADKSQPAPTT